MSGDEALQIVEPCFDGVLIAHLVRLQNCGPTLFHTDIVQPQKGGGNRNAEQQQNDQLPCFDVLELPDTSPNLSPVCHKDLSHRILLLSV